LWCLKYLKATPPTQTTTDQRQPENVEYFNYLCVIVTNDAKCTREIKSMIVMAKAASNKKALFTNKLDLYFRKNLAKCCIWSVALHGAETLRKF
jgi:hypothetical protein